VVESAEGGERPRGADEPASWASDASRHHGGGSPSDCATGRAEDPASSASAGDDDARPDGDVYDWYRRGLGLLQSGNAAAAAQLLGHAAAAEPTSRSVREALARAQFDAGWYADARDNFARIIEENPADDYAQFGLGLSAARTGDLQRAVEHLALAVAMRPDLGHYGTALRGARAALSRR
jgi:tetratricopeptide (TPR) repeat protein